MIAVRRVVVVGLVFSLALSGPFAQIAGAQQPQQQPATPAQPDLLEEAFKVTGQAPAPAGTSFQPAPTMQPEAMKPVNGRQLDDEFYEVFAGVATAFLVPGRAMTCVLGSGVALGVFVISFGTAYRGATRVMEEGCGGKWVVNADDLRPRATQIDMPVER